MSPTCQLTQKFLTLGMALEACFSVKHPSFKKLNLLFFSYLFRSAQQPGAQSLIGPSAVKAAAAAVWVAGPVRRGTTAATLPRWRYRGLGRVNSLRAPEGCQTWRSECTLCWVCFAWRYWSSSSTVSVLPSGMLLSFIFSFLNAHFCVCL